MTRRGSKKGFALVELLIVMVIMGLVVAAIYSLHQSSQRSAYTQDEVVEVQQNLRVAMDQIARDLYMARFLVRETHAPLSEAAATAMTIRTTAIKRRTARIASDFISPSGTGTVKEDIEIESADMVDLFESGDYVRIVRPSSKDQPLDRVFTVYSKDRTGPHLDLVGFNEAVKFKKEDLIFQVLDDNADGDDDPNTPASTLPSTLKFTSTIRYFLEDDPESDDANMQLLKRETSGSGAEIVAMKVTALEFKYLLEGGSETDSPSATEREEIVAVRITLTGATDATRTGRAEYSGIKTRSVSSVVRLRNI